MSDFYIELAATNAQLKQKIIFWQEKYKRQHALIDDKKMRNYVNDKVKCEIKELIYLNISPTISLLHS